MINKSYLYQADLLFAGDTTHCHREYTGIKGRNSYQSFPAQYARLSVDIDLTYLPFDDRETALTSISESLGRIRNRIRKSFPETTINEHTIEGSDIKLWSSLGMLRSRSK